MFFFDIASFDGKDLEDCNDLKDVQSDFKRSLPWKVSSLVWKESNFIRRVPICRENGAREKDSYFSKGHHWGATTASNGFKKNLGHYLCTLTSPERGWWDLKKYFSPKLRPGGHPRCWPRIWDPSLVLHWSTIGYDGCWWVWLRVMISSKFWAEVQGSTTSLTRIYRNLPYYSSWSAPQINTLGKVWVKIIFSTFLQFSESGKYSSARDHTVECAAHQRFRSPRSKLEKCATHCTYMQYRSRTSVST